MFFRLKNRRILCFVLALLSPNSGYPHGNSPGSGPWHATQLVVAPSDSVAKRALEVSVVSEEQATLARILIDPIDHDGRFVPDGHYGSAAFRKIDEALRPHSDLYGKTMYYNKTDGRLLGHLPPGRYQITAFKGTEYRPASATWDSETDPAALKLTLNRWIDAVAMGWYSGDLHVHVKREAGDDDRIFNWMAAEDLNLLTALYMTGYGEKYNVQTRYGRQGDAKRGRMVISSGDEYRTRYAHTTALGIPSSVTAHFQGSYESFGGKPPAMQPDHPPLADVADWVHAQGGEFLYDHGCGAPAMVVDVVSGRVRHAELLQWANYRGLKKWYQLLNAGYRVTAVAGTDAPQFNTTGVDRTYVKVDGDFTFSSWLEGLQAGRAFVSTGPMVFWTINDHAPGSELQMAQAGTVRVRLNVSFHQPLANIALLMNGQEVKSWQPSSTNKNELEAAIPVQHSSWLAVRVRGHSGPVIPLAHSNPIYVLVDNAPIWSADANEALLKRVHLSLHGLTRRHFISRMSKPQREDIFQWYIAGLDRLAIACITPLSTYDQLPVDKQAEIQRQAKHRINGLIAAIGLKRLRE